MRQMSLLKKPHGRVSIDLEWPKLLELMQSGALCGADIHVSDPEMKALIQQACLKSCVQKVCAHCDMSELCAQPCCSLSDACDTAIKQVVNTAPFTL